MMVAHAYLPSSSSTASPIHHHRSPLHSHRSSMPSPSIPRNASQASTSSPVHSSPSSTSSSGSALRYSALSIGSSGNSASWVGSDGTAATSEGGSPAPTSSLAPPSSLQPNPHHPTRHAALLLSQGTKPNNSINPKRSHPIPPSPTPATVQPDPCASSSSSSGDRLRKCSSTSALRDSRPKSSIKRKASAGSSSAQAETLECIRKEEMRRVQPEPANQLAESSHRQPTQQQQHQHQQQSSSQDEPMRDVPASPDTSRKLRRKKEANLATCLNPTPQETEGGAKRRRRKRPSKSSRASAALRADEQDEDEEDEDEEEHIDLATYPQEQLLRLVASLLTQIATANDALRPIAPPTSSSGSGLRPRNRGSSTSLASGFSSPGGSLARRTTRAFEMALMTTVEEQKTPWNSMPSSPFVERPHFISSGHSFSSGSGGGGAGGRRMGSLSRPPTPGASRPASPILSRRTSHMLLPPIASVTSLADDDVFSACRLALDSPSATLAFHARVIPPISIEAYLLRILKYCPTSNEVFLSLLVYFDRMARMGLGAGVESYRVSSSSSFSLENGDDEVMRGGNGNGDGGASASATGSTDDGVIKEEVKPFAIDSFNVHRLVIAGVTVASKFFSDVFYTNARYAKVGGLPLHELDALELQFLLLNDFRLMVPLDEMQRYADQLLMHWSGAEGTCGFRPPKPPRGKGVACDETIVEVDGDDEGDDGDDGDEEGPYSDAEDDEEADEEEEADPGPSLYRSNRSKNDQMGQPDPSTANTKMAVPVASSPSTTPGCVHDDVTTESRYPTTASTTTAEAVCQRHQHEARSAVQDYHAQVVASSDPQSLSSSTLSTSYFCTTAPTLSHRSLCHSTSSSTTASTTSSTPSVVASGGGCGVVSGVVSGVGVGITPSHASTFSHFNPGLPKSRPSSSGISIASAQSSEASASTVTPGTPKASSSMDVWSGVGSSTCTSSEGVGYFEGPGGFTVVSAGAAGGGGGGGEDEDEEGERDESDFDDEEDADDDDNDDDDDDENWESSDEGGAAVDDDASTSLNRIRLEHVSPTTPTPTTTPQT